ncbi:N-formylmaleamate deformylase, NicD (plasmid) [Cupriavidus necator H850]|uniref:alpha/beta fold hydrolase n=1 Tax=Cupriavidus necator TaxID=106590 RepID=UPI00129E07E2|nr:alpha/beta hydrolase [Cupriavidus necator]KAI3601379.1 N-formylmaleamate deformylase, NicD [Cupriavidus necator H850]
MSLGTGGAIRANEIRQHYFHFAGHGPRILIVPGIVSPAILWSDVGSWLAKDHDCFVLDVRGRGLSESGAHLDYGIDSCAKDVAAFIRGMQLGPTVVIGHSMGARIALRMAAYDPEFVRSLVLVDPPTSGPGRRAYPVPIARTLGLLRAAHRGQGAEALRTSTAAPWPENLQRLRAEWLSTCDERAVYAAYEDFHSQDMFADLAKTRLPVSLICAGEGGVVSEADVEEMRQLRPDMLTVRLEGAGHQMQAEDFAGFIRVLGEVLIRQFQSEERSRS